MREQLQNERDNAAAHGNTVLVAKLDRLLDPTQAERDEAAVARAVALANRRTAPAVRRKADQTRGSDA